MKELAPSYLTITKDLGRVMARVKAQQPSTWRGRAEQISLDQMG